MPPRIRFDMRDRQGGRVAWVTVDNPEKLNILTSPVVRALRDQVRALAEDAEVRALVLTGAGHRSFIAGADLNELKEKTPETGRAFITLLHEAHLALREFPAPVIARVNGFCLGAGMETAASCDIRIACRSARFGMPEVRVGLPSVVEAALLPGIMGWGMARDLMLTGDVIDAAEAHRCGFVDRLVEDAALDDAVEACVDSILQSGPRAVRQQKALFREWENVPVERGIEIAIDYLADAFTTDEPRRLMESFFENRRKQRAQ